MPDPVQTTELAPAATTATPTATTTPNPAPAATTTPTGAAPTGTPAEDRSNWIPPHRLKEETDKRNRLDAEYKAAQAKITEYENKLRVALGVQEPDPNKAKREQIQKEFYDLFPEQKELQNVIAQQKAAQARESKRHADSMFTHVFSDVAEHAGVEELSPRQQTHLRAAFQAWFSETVEAELRASGGEQSATLDRWESGDRKLLSEFSGDYVKEWLEPLKRTATAPAISQATKRVPDSTKRTQVSSIQKPESFKTLDERLEYAVKLAKERGMQFGG